MLRRGRNELVQYIQVLLLQLTILVLSISPRLSLVTFIVVTFRLTFELLTMVKIAIAGGSGRM